MFRFGQCKPRLIKAVIATKICRQEEKGRELDLAFRKMLGSVPRIQGAMPAGLQGSTTSLHNPPSHAGQGSGVYLSPFLNLVSARALGACRIKGVADLDMRRGSLQPQLAVDPCTVHA
jgi:hypothetical protein